MRIARTQWVIAVAVAAGVHVAVAAVVFWQQRSPGARDAGVGGIEVSLGPAGSAPGGLGQPVAASEVDPVQAPETATETPVEVVAPQPPNEVEVQPVQDSASAVAQEVEAIEPPAVVEAVEAPTPLIDEAVAVEPQAARRTEPPPLPRTKPPPLERVPQLDTAQEVRPGAAPAPTPEEPAPQSPAPVSAPPATAPIPTDRVAVVAPPSSAGAGGRTGSQDQPEAGSAETQSSGGGRPGAAANYITRLQIWLERHKEYPRRARQRRQQGTAMLTFVMDRAGRVVEFKITRTSGHRILDREVAAMLKRAQPLPPMPDEMPDPRLEVVVPAQFSLS